jgi:hypothetical protein
MPSPTPIPAINDSNAIDLAANSYVDLEEARTYFDNRANSGDWFSLGPDDQARALITAAQMLDESRRWIGGLVREDQPLQWPRVAIRPIERRSRRTIRTGFETLTGATGGLYDLRQRFWAATSIPTPIKSAQCEFAFALITGFDSGASKSIKSFSEEGVSVTYDRPQQRGELPMEIARLLGPLSLGGPETARG